MNFVTKLSILINWKDKIYNSILVWLTKIVYYKPVKVIINALELVEFILNIVI